MAHKKAGGSTANVHDSNSKRLGVKAFGDQVVKTGDIIVRQRGTHFFAGQNVFMGIDHTLHAAVPGKVTFQRVKKLGYDGCFKTRMRVAVLAEQSSNGTRLRSKSQVAK